MSSGVSYEKAISKFTKKRIGEVLLAENLVTTEELEEALRLQKKQGGRLGQILVNQGIVRAEDLVRILTNQYNVPFVDVKIETIEPTALQLIPEELARKHSLIPINASGDSLTVVMAYPDDIRALRDIKAMSGKKVEIALGIPSDIENAIDMYYRSTNEIQEQVNRFGAASEEDTEVTPELIARTPVTQSLDLLIQQAIRDRASDIHLEPQEHHLRVRYRIDGILYDMFSLPKSFHTPILSRVKILAEMNIAEHRRPQDGQFSVKVGDRDIDVRVATFGISHGERATLRILDKSLTLFALSELGLSHRALNSYESLLSNSYGMILVGGPTGSGKTTTLYASINKLNQNEVNILTIEDPIEYRFSGINQSQVNPKIGVTFASGLRAILRHDPDIILVGEIRDRDTAETAIQAALTGHLVLSSIHGNDAVGVIFRLMDLGIEPYLISSTLLGIVAQRMIRRVCSNCPTQYQPSVEEHLAYNLELQEELTTAFKGKGCHLCAGTGYRGRTGIFEVLVMQESIRRMLLSNSSAEEIKEEAIRRGMITMRQDGMMKVREGITTVSEILRSVVSTD